MKESKEKTPEGPFQAKTVKLFSGKRTPAKRWGIGRGGSLNSSVFEWEIFASNIYVETKGASLLLSWNQSPAAPAGAFAVMMVMRGPL